MLPQEGQPLPSSGIEGGLLAGPPPGWLGSQLPIHEGIVPCDQEVASSAQRLRERQRLEGNGVAEPLPGDLIRGPQTNPRAGVEEEPKPAYRRRIGSLLRLIN